MRDDIAIRSRERAAENRRVTSLDGLRVLAIVGVLVYHMNGRWLPGGFFGVTMFFVLTGYLITSSILKQLAADGTVGLWRFYCHRIRRLWPTMLVVVLLVAVLTAVFAPHLLVKMQPDVVPALLFYDNWWYIFNDLSYFAAAGQPSPLTHFWYLGVVGQFYLIWPLILMLVWRIGHRRRYVGFLSFALMIASFIAMVVMFDPNGDPSRVYYGTDTRFAELMVGACAAVLVPLMPLRAPQQKRSQAPLSSRLATIDSPSVRHGEGYDDRFDDRGRAGYGRADSYGSRRSSSGRNLPGFMRPIMRIVHNNAIMDIAGVVALAVLVWMAFTLNGYSPFLYRGGLLIAAILTGIVVVAIVNRRSVFGKVLGLKPFQVGSARTFAVYMWHYPLLLIMNPATRTTELPWWGWVIELIVIIAVSEVSYRVIEKTTGGGQIGNLVAGVRNGDISLGREIAAHRIQMTAGGLFVVLVVVLLVIGPVWAQVDQNAAGEVKTASVDDVAGSGEAIDAAQQQAAEQVAADQQAAENAEQAAQVIDPETGQCHLKVLCIGDSIAETCIGEFNELFPEGRINAVIGRQLVKGPEVYQEEIASGYQPDCVVFVLGTNGVAYEDQVRELLECVDPSIPVYLQNIRTTEDLGWMNNDLYNQIVPDYPNVTLIDWYGYTTGHDEWIEPDGEHPNVAGARAWAEMIRDVVSAGSTATSTSS